MLLCKGSTPLADTMQPSPPFELDETTTQGAESLDIDDVTVVQGMRPSANYDIAFLRAK